MAMQKCGNSPLLECPRVCNHLLRSPLWCVVATLFLCFRWHLHAHAFDNCASRCTHTSYIFQDVRETMRAASAHSSAWRYFTLLSPTISSVGVSSVEPAMTAPVLCLTTGCFKRLACAKPCRTRTRDCCMCLLSKKYRLWSLPTIKFQCASACPCKQHKISRGA